jgi:hypothetical protein
VYRATQYTGIQGYAVHRYTGLHRYRGLYSTQFYSTTQYTDIQSYIVHRCTGLHRTYSGTQGSTVHSCREVIRAADQPSVDRKKDSVRYTGLRATMQYTGTILQHTERAMPRDSTVPS